MRVRAPHSLRARLTALVAVTGAGLALASWFGAALVLQRQIDAALDEGLGERVADVAAEWRSGSGTLLADPFAQVLTADGGVAARSASASQTPLLTVDQLAAGLGSTLRLDVTVPTLRGPTRLLARPVDGVVVIVGEPLTTLRQTQDRLENASAAVLLVMLVALTASTWVLAGAALRPVARMTTAADRLLSDPARSGSLPLPPGDDELSRLARTLNRLLLALSAAADRERSLVDDASHELRTPLAVLRGELELTLDEPDPDRRREGVERALADVERLSVLTEDLLVLARESRGGGRRREPLEVVPWLREAAREAVPPGVDVSVRADPDSDGDVGDGARMRVSADPSALARAMGNVLRNAVAAGAIRIDVRVSRRDGMAVVRVCDDGPGFPPAALDHVFDRFFRVDPSRSPPPVPGTSGAGLGLAIVKAVVEAHGGAVRAANVPGGGAVVEFSVPVADAP